MLKRIPLILLCAAAVTLRAEKPTEGKPISLNEALILALENNISLQTRRLDPLITEQNEPVARATFDPKFSASTELSAYSVENTADETRSANDLTLETGLSKKFATGTSVHLSTDLERDETTSSSSDDKQYSDSLDTELTITQALLSGRGRAVNLASVHRAELNTAISKQQLRRYIETLIYNVTSAYWNLFLEQKKLAVYQESYDMALEHEREVEVFIKNGKVAEIELAQVQGEVSSRREKLIQERGAIEKKSLTLLGILNYNDLTDEAWQQHLLPNDNPRKMYTAMEDAQTYVDVALLNRPEIKEYQLKIDREEIDLVTTKDGLLPQLDFFITLGRTDYANAFNTASDTRNHTEELSVGLDFSHAIGRRADRARYKQDLLSTQRAELALDNLIDSISQEVRQAYIDCTTNLETIDAVAITRDLRRQSLKTQTIKFELGKATNNDIADAQRDLLESQIDHTEAVVDYVKSRLKLHYLDSSLLERSGVVLP